MLKALSKHSLVVSLDDVDVVPFAVSELFSEMDYRLSKAHAHGKK